MEGIINLLVIDSGQIEELYSFPYDLYDPVLYPSREGAMKKAKSLFLERFYTVMGGNYTEEQKREALEKNYFWNGSSKEIEIIESTRIIK